MYDLISYGFLTPPAVLIVLCLVGGFLALVWRGFGVALVILSAAALFLLATPVAASWLLEQVEAGLPETPELRGAQAIVVLGGDVHLGDGKAVPDSLGPQSLERVLYAAQAYRSLHLPVAVSGGPVLGSDATVGGLMKEALERDFAVPVAWNEDRSRTTQENALFTAQLLRAEGIATVVLVSHAWHLPRGLWAFERAGLKPLPWPAPRSVVRLRRIDDFLPSIAALHDSFYALHEMFGEVYYRLRY
jgi:uncharacterized SAM-binding protein YcdF (DUF218 family)